MEVASEDGVSVVVGRVALLLEGFQEIVPVPTPEPFTSKYCRYVFPDAPTKVIFTIA